jgi:hypothetical protein
MNGVERSGLFYRRHFIELMDEPMTRLKRAFRPCPTVRVGFALLRSTTTGIASSIKRRDFDVVK